MNLDDCRLIEIPDEVLKISNLTQLWLRNNKVAVTVRGSISLCLSLSPSVSLSIALPNPVYYV